MRVQRETERSNHERAKGFFLSVLEGHGNKRRSGRRSGAALGRTWENSGLGLGSDTSDMVCGGPRSRRPHTSLGRTYGGGLQLGSERWSGLVGTLARPLREMGAEAEQKGDLTCLPASPGF